MKKLLLLIAFAASAFAAGHSITIGWTDSINAAGTTYNVYRLVGVCPATAPNSAPPAGFNLLISAVAAKTLTDSAVLPATTYCYLVTAVVAGTESAPSNDAQALEPTSFPPTMLQVIGIQ